MVPNTLGILDRTTEVEEEPKVRGGRTDGSRREERERQGVCVIHERPEVGERESKGRRML